jgi:hypothetical protein|tara:strand:+ start:145 stop:399 length:255 start_codon:yes stop_codon:yes gene_type:complete
MPEKTIFKYYNLYTYLVNSNKKVLVLTISEIEEILGFTLPKSSSILSWWANDPFSGQTQARAWYDAGYLISIKGDKMIFRKKIS